MPPLALPKQEDVAAKKKKPPSTLSHVVSGITGSLFAEQVLFPLDTIKIRSQTSAVGDSGGFVHTALAVFEQEGPAGFYRGLSGALFKEAFHSANFWLWHSLLVRNAILKNEGATRLLLRNLVCKQLNWLCTTPLEVLSSLNQITPGSPGLLAVARNLIAEGGIGSLYRGLPISLSLAINPAMMMMLIHKQLELVTFLRKRMGEDPKQAKDHGPTTMFYCTAIAKTIATLLTYPLIRAKVVMQVHGGGLSDVPRILRQIVAMEGYGGLYKGIVAMTWKTVLHNALMMSMKHFLNPLKPETPPASPRGQNIQPMENFSRSVPPVEAMAEKLDEIIERLGHHTSVDHMRSVEERVERVEISVENIKTEIGGLSNDVRQVKDLLVSLHAQTNGKII